MTYSLLDFRNARFHSPKLKEFIVDVVIPPLLQFFVKDFIDLGFQVSIWNPEIVEGQI